MHNKMSKKIANIKIFDSQIFHFFYSNVNFL